MNEFSDQELIKIAQVINNFFDNGCGCCSKDDHDYEGMIKFLRKFIEDIKHGNR